MASMALGSDFITYVDTVDTVARCLRLLYIQDLRNLQTKINETIVSVQNITANPKTDTKLGKVGKWMVVNIRLLVYHKEHVFGNILKQDVSCRSYVSSSIEFIERLVDTLHYSARYLSKMMNFNLFLRCWCSCQICEHVDYAKSTRSHLFRYRNRIDITRVCIDFRKFNEEYSASVSKTCLVNLFICEQVDWMLSENIRPI